ncbi:nucleotidyl transferase AbiEii/AbiGii toxin family protein [Patescibacteria group bacterium]|nr:nucleotidyl transferase AbiEii/AbiGii toxin family protein [Patescibacteria group bacterium]MBU4162126.1 nucleotidyl transferase AbiEii/AbiGii toxin family protein [Patescibacteria group bacterium]
MISEFLWQTILEEGKSLEVPETKKRALIREYLQCKTIYHLYNQPKSEKLSFIGETSLRILRNIDRFSEDLDFDNLGLSHEKIRSLFKEISSEFKKENLEAEFNFKKTNNSGIGSFKFPKLLFDLGITTDKNEKLNVKINYTTPKTRPETEVVILKRFGFLRPVITNTKSFLLSQKIRAALTRKDIQPRDFYDIAWLLSYRVKPHPKLFSEMKVKTEKELFEKLTDVYKRKVKLNIKDFKKKLKPFLLDDKNIDYLDIFDKTIE